MIEPHRQWVRNPWLAIAVPECHPVSRWIGTQRCSRGWRRHPTCPHPTMPLEDLNDWRRHLAREALRTDDEAGHAVLGFLALIATTMAVGVALLLAHVFSG